MAKKKAVRGEFNMSSEIRNLLQSNPNQTSREVYDALQAQFPGQSINRNSCNVAFSHARRKLGIRGGAARAVRRPRPGVASASSSQGSLSLGILQAARDLVTQAGDSASAIRAIEQLQSLQLN